MTIAAQKRLLEAALKGIPAVRDVRVRIGVPARLLVTVEPGADISAVRAAAARARTANPVEVSVDGRRLARTL